MTETQDDGLEELQRLSRQISSAGKQEVKKRQDDSKRREMVQGLRQLKISVACQQLDMVSTAEMAERVRALGDKRGNDELRKIISDIAAEMELDVDGGSITGEAYAALGTKVRTLNVLLELLFSLE